MIFFTSPVGGNAAKGSLRSSRQAAALHPIHVADVVA